MLPLLFALALLARGRTRRVDVGIGPLPIVSHEHHKRALRLYGYSAETFVTFTFYITQDFDHLLHKRYPQHRPIIHVLAFWFAIRRYRCLYFYFDGGPLGATKLLWRFEGTLLRLAGVKTLLMPYGSDVQVMTRSPNLLFKSLYSRQYRANLLRRREVTARLDLWTRAASHIVSGCEWVDYMYCWDTLMLAHFSIDTDEWRASQPPPAKGRPFRILHAPNHRSLKGTDYLIAAVEALRKEGYTIELDVAERISNVEVRARIAQADLVADQFVIGWYAMFAIEAMALERPVLCYLRDDLERLYVLSGLIGPGEIPIARCDPVTVKDTIRELINSPERRVELGRRGRAFVERHHSIRAVGATFDGINRLLELSPSGLPAPIRIDAAAEQTVH
jgi:glycosyltransferase involved in cell wall biosynthesis